MTDVVTNFKKSKPIRDRKHLRTVGELPSCISGGRPCHPHHLRIGDGKGGFRDKAGDDMVLPLTIGEHVADADCVHSVGSGEPELDWFQARGISDPVGLAQKLYMAFDKAHMRQILEEAK